MNEKSVLYKIKNVLDSIPLRIIILLSFVLISYCIYDVFTGLRVFHSLFNVCLFLIPIVLFDLRLLLEELESELESRNRFEGNKMNRKDKDFEDFLSSLKYSIPMCVGTLISLVLQHYGYANAFPLAIVIIITSVLKLIKDSFTPSKTRKDFHQ